MTRRIILAIILLSVLQAATAQTGDQLFKKALQKFRYVEITNHKWIELNGKKQLLFPVRADDMEGWTLYNASTEKAVLDEKFEFILDYIVSSTQSGILYKENNGFIYRFWQGLPGQGTADSVQIDYLHYNKFVNDYAGITEPTAKQPAYLHISGRKDALTGLSDSAILSPYIDAKFQLAKSAGVTPATLLLIDKAVHAWYASVQPQPANTYLVENAGQFWYLRFFPDKLDSVGPFTYAENFEKNQEYGVVKDNVEGFRVLSLRNFKLYSIPKKSTEAVANLIYLKGTNQFVCRYNNSHGSLWSLLEADATSLDRKIDSLAMDGRRNIRPVYGRGILLSVTVSSAEFIPDVKTPKATKGIIDNIDFESIQSRTYSYETPAKVTKHVYTITGTVSTNARRRVAYYYNAGLKSFELIKNNIDKIIYKGGRFFISKDQNGWNITDLQTGDAVDPPKGTKIIWLTEFTGLEDDAETFYTSCLLRIGNEDVLEYMDNKGKLAPHMKLFKANKNITK